MSIDRIDHAAEARREASTAINDPELTAHEAEMRLRYAQVHAMLALVEQQRTANLIALMTSGVRQVAEGTTTVEAYLELHSKIAPQVGEVLGL